ncbi:L-threonylcarbamoyladenylate synthase [Deinococcus taeanensis]|uniref:L-threonylcarbamoyladenylate synthase n=1 Tax=Deinococcus taeanensis TaxID=2737050 RepID=UPI001CDC13AE|nr:L-threonylcarbamoyladenylate synthase [Deinococcus taeanensis]UBV43315.1 L-threonylcarbamoyladenylate synthase [Deinococcus taeanensis]
MSLPLPALSELAPGVNWVALLDHAAAVLEGGGVVAYPSETVWGLAALPGQAGGVQRLYEVKGRAAQKPVQVSCLNVGVAQQLVVPDPALECLAGFLPGPVTVVTPAVSSCPAALAPEGRVGVRVPDHPVALALLWRVGGLLATTSCNPSGQSPALSYGEALGMGLADLVLPDAGVAARGVPSTVVLLPERKVLREGAVPGAALLARLSGVPQ